MSTEEITESINIDNTLEQLFKKFSQKWNFVGDIKIPEIKSEFILIIKEKRKIITNSVKDFVEAMKEEVSDVFKLKNSISTPKSVPLAKAVALLLVIKTKSQDISDDLDLVFGNTFEDLKFEDLTSETGIFYDNESRLELLKSVFEGFTISELNDEELLALTNYNENLISKDRIIATGRRETDYVIDKAALKGVSALTEPETRKLPFIVGLVLKCSNEQKQISVNQFLNELLKNFKLHGMNLIDRIDTNLGGEKIEKEDLSRFMTTLFTKLNRLQYSLTFSGFNQKQ